MGDEKFVVSVVWRFKTVTNTVKEFKHDELAVAVGRAISFAKLSARAMAVGSSELFGQYTVESGQPASVHYDSATDGRIAQLMKTHNRSKA